MSEIKLTNEIYFALAKCKDAKSAMDMLKSKGYDITEENAESLWSAVQNHVLTDEELDKLTGGTLPLAIVLGTSSVSFACVADTVNVVPTTSPFKGNTSVTQGGAI